MSEQATTIDLFSGTPQPMGGLSNERELVDACPKEFFGSSNPWNKAANSIFFRGSKLSDWQFRTADKDERARQVRCLMGALKGWDLPHERKSAICGWMLSEMLTAVPS